MIAGMVVGVVVGLVVGLVYVVSLRHSLSKAAGVPVRHAIRLAQFGSFTRLLFVVAAFTLARRLVPDIDFTSGLLAALACVAVTMAGVARKGVRA